LDIKNPGTYSAPDETLVLQTGPETSAGQAFNLTKWWNITEGERLSKPFDVGEELVAGLLSALKMVRAIFYIQILYSFQGYSG
jgi:hypothetical protein